MKTYSKITLLGIMLCFSLPSLAQKPKTGCIDVNIQGQADGIKLGLSKQGHIMFQEGVFQMTSMEPTPIAVKMSQGISYQLIFVGSENSNRMIMELYDGKDRKIDEKVERGSSNSIVYTFTPSKTDIYLVTLIQKRATKDMCGYFGVMMKSARPVASARPVQPGQPQPAAPSTVQKKAPAKVAATPAREATPPPPPAKAVPSMENGYKDMPANQRPNPNRTRATREAQQNKY